MNDHRFDALARTLAAGTSRRNAFLGGALVLLSQTGTRRGRGDAQDAGTPGATPASAATPDVLDVLSGTPPVVGASEALGRDADCCPPECYNPNAGKTIFYYQPVCPGPVWNDLRYWCSNLEPACNGLCEFRCQGG